MKGVQNPFSTPQEKPFPFSATCTAHKHTYTRLEAAGKLSARVLCVWIFQFFTPLRVISRTCCRCTHARGFAEKRVKSGNGTIFSPVNGLCLYYPSFWSGSTPWLVADLSGFNGVFRFFFADWFVEINLIRFGFTSCNEAEILTVQQKWVVFRTEIQWSALVLI